MAAFDNDFYLSKNPDVAAAIKAGQYANAYQHYQMYGQNEGRTTNPNTGGVIVGGYYNPPAAQPTAPTTPATPPLDPSSIVNPVNQNTNAGFSNLNNNLNQGLGAINTGLGTVNNNINTGFTGLNNNLGAVNTGVTNVGKAVEEGNKANTAGFTGINTALATQNTNLDKIGSNLNSYFTTLNAGNDANKAQLNTLNSGFNAFRGDYDKNTIRNDQNINQLNQSVTGGFNDVTKQIANTSNATQEGLRNLSQPQQQGARNLMSGVAGNGFANRPSPGANTSGAQPGAGQGGNPQVLQGINAVRSVLASQGGSLDPSLSNSFNQIATSFDQNGQLIPSSQGMGGITVQRQVDEQGNLITAQTDPNGQVLSQTMINMNASFMTANSLSQAARSPFSYS